MDKQCLHCDSLNFKDEAVSNEFTSCCNKGSILIPPLVEIPQYIKQLYIGMLFIISNYFIFNTQIII